MIIKADKGKAIQWERDNVFTIEFCANTEEDRSALLDAMRDRKNIKVKLDLEE